MKGYHLHSLFEINHPMFAYEVSANKNRKNFRSSGL